MIIIAGCGALGSQIALHIATPDRQFLLIDDDRVEEHNIGTSIYSLHHVGALKAVVLAELLYRKCETRSRVVTRTIDKPLDASGFWAENIALVVDTFDNVEARALTCGLEHVAAAYSRVPTLHVGVSEQRTGAVVWDEDYILPESEYGRGENPVCTHHLGRRILQFTVAVATEAIEHFLETNEQLSYIIPRPNQILKF